MRAYRPSLVAAGSTSSVTDVRLAHEQVVRDRIAYFMTVFRSAHDVNMRFDRNGREFRQRKTQDNLVSNPSSISFT